MNLFLSFYVLLLGGGLAAKGIYASTAEHEPLDLSDSNKDMCLDPPCHQDATCVAVGPDMYECMCDDDLVGDGITSCEVPRSPKDMSFIMEAERILKKKKKKKSAIAPSSMPSRSPSRSPSSMPSKRPSKHPTSLPCFPGDSVVTVEGKGDVMMRDLEIGNRVLGMDGKYTPVYAFGHQDFEITSQYVRIYTNVTSTPPLGISGEHYLFLHDQQEVPALPQFLKIGDVLLGVQDMKPLKVIKIESVTSKGLFAPLTADGTIAVNGIVCSNYVHSFLGTDLSPDYVYLLNYKIMARNAFNHMRYSPVRLAALGISPSVGKLSGSEGMNYLTCTYLYVYKWMDPVVTSNYAQRVFGYFMLYSMFGFAWFCFGIECLVGPSMGPAVIAIAGVVAGVVMNKMQKKKGSDLKAKID